MDVSFERTRTGKDEWLTPPEIVRSLGAFDLDPCAPVIRPWSTAKRHYTIEDDGLRKKWFGRVWCNPPYGRETGKWLERMVEHANGIALIFARTETANFFRYIWPSASGIMFLKGRLVFHNVDGSRPDNSAGAPSCLIAYGQANAHILRESGLEGKFLSIEPVGADTVVEKIIKFALKAIFIAWLILFIISHITSVRLDSFLLPITLLVIGLMLIKRWLPFVYALIKRAASWFLKTATNLLWTKPERKGGANVRQPRMRWM